MEIGKVASSLAVTGLALATLWLAWELAGGAPGLLYAAIYLLALTPGWPLGFACFERSPGVRPSHGWIIGSVIGYALTALALWVVIALGHHGRPAFLIAWMIAIGAGWGAALLVRRPVVALAPWTRRDVLAMALVLLLVPALFWLPYRHAGATTPDGTRLYRAYFTADFVWHTALTAELRRFDMPPIDPYLAPARIHYYWTYFLVPAAVSGAGPRALADVQTCLKLNALFSALLFLAMIYITARAVVPSALAAGVAVALTVTAASAEGFYAVVDLLRRGRALDGLTQLNIDAITSWFFHGLRMDGLPRAMWWNPQHSMSCALGLIALPIAAGGLHGPRPAALAGLALAASAAFNPFIGGVFALIYGGAVVFTSILHAPRSLVRLPWQAAAVAPVLLALAWAASNQMVEGAGGVLAVGIAGAARQAPLATLLLSLGPILVPAVLGLMWRYRALAPDIVPPLFGLCVGLVLLYGVRLTVDPFWMSFRAGQILQLMLPGLLAFFLAGWFNGGRRAAAGIGIVAVIAAVGLPTTLIDVYNAQDTTNQGMAPGFRWTVPVTRAQQAAFDWVRTNTPPAAIVQMEPVSRGRDTWSLIPSFAERRMAAGLPISLMNVPAYQERSEQVRGIYAGTSASEAWDVARRLAIDYLYLDSVERTAYAGVPTEKFDAAPEYFTPVYRNAEVRIYRVNGER